MEVERACKISSMFREGKRAVQDLAYAKISDTGMENKRGNLCKNGEIKLDNCWPVPNQISCILYIFIEGRLETFHEWVVHVRVCSQLVNLLVFHALSCLLMGFLVSSDI